MEPNREDMMSEFTHRLPRRPWSKPSKNEAEYFRREEFRNRMEAARLHEAERAEADRRHWLEEHGNRCPKCSGELQPLTTRSEQGDQCPNCLGVWLEYEVFDHLTHPDQRNDYLTGIFREVFLQYTTGRLGREGNR